MMGPAVVGILLALLLGDLGIGDQKRRKVGQESTGNASIRRLDPAAESPLLIAWTRDHLPMITERTPATQTAALHRLSDLLLGPHGLGLEESIGFTPTATGAFLTGRANCLAFAHLAMAIGRRAGIDLVYIEVLARPTIDQTPALRVVHRHAAVALLTDHDALVLDFGGIERKPRDAVRMLTDHQARGLFLANRGAEKLIDGEAEAALPWLEAAVELVEEAWLWRNLALALVRTGRPAAAAVAREHARELSQHPQTSDPMTRINR